MKAVKSNAIQGAFIVTDGEKVYSVEQGRITAHRLRHCCRVYVSIDREKFPKLANRIDAACAAAS